MEEKQNSNRRAFFSSLAAAAGMLVAAPRLLAQAVSGQQGGSTAQSSGNQPNTGQRRRRPPVTHNGLIFISGQGANDGGPVQDNTIESHVRKTLENVKRAVENGGGTMDSILQLNVYLATLLDYEAMNKVYREFFPNGGPARMTVAVAGIPGRSLIEINGIAAVVNATNNG